MVLPIGEFAKGDCSQVIINARSLCADYYDLRETDVLEKQIKWREITGFTVRFDTTGCSKILLDLISVGAGNGQARSLHLLGERDWTRAGTDEKVNPNAEHSRMTI